MLKNRVVPGIEPLTAGTEEPIVPFVFLIKYLAKFCNVDIRLMNRSQASATDRLLLATLLFGVSLSFIIQICNLCKRVLKKVRKNSF